ncbi:hypothetical protein LDJ79_12640 [Vibrio tritonius]|uniref:Uncharacterized protein n=1 Tax=Vibrio tritonius TaxID=1435069 RepID=A0ABS7YMQ0_9VIBR|nr:hypothetical protein [Vibrio tritonius]MCA2016965.1 hypothetical protein [Vibrio tritonius]
MSPQMVKCFKEDCWIEKEVTALVKGDIFVSKSTTYIARSATRILYGRPQIQAVVFDSGPNFLTFGEANMDYICMAMDYTCSPAHLFDDGTMMLCDFSDGNTNTYSPRLPRKQLNEFCKNHMDEYEAFFDQNEDALESGAIISLPKFW